MWPESKEPDRNKGKETPLRTGYTTGTCATACCVGAAFWLLGQRQPEEVTVTLPKGQRAKLTLSGYEVLGNGICVSTIKNAGDDPDVTHGTRVFVELSLRDEPGITFAAASGVGTITRAGLTLPIGEPAINPVPRQMMTLHLTQLAKQHQFQGGFHVAIGIENGEQLALKTMNPRLGIIGGLSILGTTGIVRPYSCSAWIASIHQGIDVARANGIHHIAASTGNSSEQAIKQHYQLPDLALIEMGDFAGAVLKHLKKKPVQKLSLCGGFGKLTKLANGHLDLNSRQSQIDFGQLVSLAQQAGANAELMSRVENANTSMEAFALCREQNVNLAQPVCELAHAVCRRITGANVDVEIWAVDRAGRFVGASPSNLLVHAQ